MLIKQLKETLLSFLILIKFRDGTETHKASTASNQIKTRSCYLMCEIKWFFFLFAMLKIMLVAAYLVVGKFSIVELKIVCNRKGVKEGIIVSKDESHH